MIEKIYGKTKSISVKQGDILIVKFPHGMYDMEQVCQVYSNIAMVLPEGISLLPMPEDFMLDVIKVDI